MRFGDRWEWLKVLHFDFRRHAIAHGFRHFLRRDQVVQILNSDLPHFVRSSHSNSFHTGQCFDYFYASTFDAPSGPRISRINAPINAFLIRRSLRAVRLILDLAALMESAYPPLRTCKNNRLGFEDPKFASRLSSLCDCCFALGPFSQPRESFVVCSLEAGICWLPFFGEGGGLVFSPFLLPMAPCLGLDDAIVASCFLVAIGEALVAVFLTVLPVFRPIIVILVSWIFSVVAERDLVGKEKAGLTGAESL